MRVLAVRRRRLVRHEGGRLSRIRRDPACGAGARPPDQVARRAQRQLPLRPARPGDDRRGRAGARRGRQFPCGARAQPRRHGRLSDRVRAGHARGQHAEEPAEPVPHADRRDLDPMRVHQHRADRPVSRRRAARGQLRHGAAGRRGGARDRPRSGGAAAAEPDSQQRDAIQAPHRGSNTTAAISPRSSTPASSEADWAGFAARRDASARRDGCAGAASPAISRSPRRPARRWAASASSRTAG